MSQATKSQIDPLNRKNYGAITAMLTVVDVKDLCILPKGLRL